MYYNYCFAMYIGCLRKIAVGVTSKLLCKCKYVWMYVIMVKHWIHLATQKVASPHSGVSCMSSFFVP